MRLDDSVHPTIYAPRWVLLAMKDKIFEELNRMTKLGVKSLGSHSVGSNQFMNPLSGYLRWWLPASRTVA